VRWVSRRGPHIPVKAIVSKTVPNIPIRIAPGSVDLVCLSEMVFTGGYPNLYPVRSDDPELTLSSPQLIPTGYVFPTADSIKPFLEDPITGPTSKFCAELAIHLRCHVVAGFPERLSDDEVEPGVDEWGNAITRVGANSVILFGPEGECVGKYRKTNLFETDTTWAKPGKAPYPRFGGFVFDLLDW